MKPCAVLALVIGMPFASTVFASDTAEQEVIATEIAWNTAKMKRDRAALERIYAEESRFTDSVGKVYTRKQEIDTLMSNTYFLQSFKLSDLRVHVNGELAVVTGLNTVAAQYRGRNTSGEYRFTDVFMKRDGQWQIVASQDTYVYRR